MSNYDFYPLIKDTWWYNQPWNYAEDKTVDSLKIIKVTVHYNAFLGDKRILDICYLPFKSQGILIQLGLKKQNE